MTVLSDDLKQRLQLQVSECYKIASRRLEAVFPLPTVLFNQRGKIAGCALLQSNTLRFHPVIYQQNQLHFLEHVVPHEVAHLIVWHLYGKTAPHGKEWKSIMTQVFELPPARTHQYDVENIGVKSITYFCGCGELPLTIRRHNKVIKGFQYRCKACNETLIQKID